MTLAGNPYITILILILIRCIIIIIVIIILFLLLILLFQFLLLLLLLLLLFLPFLLLSSTTSQAYELNHLDKLKTRAHFKTIIKTNNFKCRREVSTKVEKLELLHVR